MSSAHLLRRTMATAAAAGAKQPVIGFIGLGQMGAPMSGHLFAKTEGARAKFIVHDVVSSSVDAFKAAHPGAVSAPTPADVAAEADVIFTMVPTSAHVQEVYLGARGIVQTVKRGSLLVDSSTIAPAMSQHVAKSLIEPKGVEVIDAPVSGGILGAHNATLTFMVGGPKPSLDRVTPFLNHMGKNIFHCGTDVGTGQVAKICNNMILGTTMVAVSEGLNLGVKLGMDPKLLSQIVNVSTGRCWSSDTYNPVPGVMDGVPSARNYDGGFGITLLQKDMGLALAAAESVKAPVPLAASADQLYKTIMATPGLEKKDFSVVYEWLAGLFMRHMRK
ncbi:hypothetical protein H9P43_007464 [Blastocladiella emersonii ATCC 22665]|nr:hypothetical protein H9P43_007464 [Blastocladiella emersonii ATCC 22665]